MPKQDAHLVQISAKFAQLYTLPFVIQKMVELTGSQPAPTYKFNKSSLPLPIPVPLHNMWMTPAFAFVDLPNSASTPSHQL